GSIGPAGSPGGAATAPAGPTATGPQRLTLLASGSAGGAVGPGQRFWPADARDDGPAAAADRPRLHADPHLHGADRAAAGAGRPTALRGAVPPPLPPGPAGRPVPGHPRAGQDAPHPGRAAGRLRPHLGRAAPAGTGAGEPPPSAGGVVHPAHGPGSCLTSS